MAGEAPIDDAQDQKPLDPAVESVRRKMVRFFAINIGILMIALMAVLGAIVYKATRPSQGAGEISTGEISLDPGERVVSQAIGGDRLSLLVEGSGGSRSIVVVDIRSGQVLARFRLSTGQ